MAANLSYSALTCENYVKPYSNDILSDIFHQAIDLQIPLLAVEDFSRSKRDNFVKKEDTLSLKSPSMIFDPIIHDYSAFEDRISKFKYEIRFLTGKSLIIVARKTLDGSNMSNLRKKLGSYRYNYEIIGVRIFDEKVAKWAAHDRRVDYLTVDFTSAPIIDKALCSLAKQHGTTLEVSLGSLLNQQNERQFSTILREGKKMMKIILQSKVPFILTMNASNPFMFRTATQMRYLGALLGVPYNQTRDSVFNYQLKILGSNLIKLSDSTLFEGIEEVTQ